MAAAWINQGLDGGSNTSDLGLINIQRLCDLNVKGKRRFQKTCQADQTLKIPACWGGGGGGWVIYVKVWLSLDEGSQAVTKSGPSDPA